MSISFRQAAQVAAFFVGATFATAGWALPGLSWTVDCSRGQSISRALAHAPPGMKLTLMVRGACNESVLIERDDVTLQGDPATGAILIPPPAAAIAIDIRAMRAVIDRMTIQGGSDGIRITGAHDASIAHVVVRNVAGRGMVVRNAHAIVLASTIEGSGADGVFLMRGSVRMADSQVRSNRGVGIDLVNAAGLNVTGSTIASNGSNGIRLSGGSQATIVGSTITGNGFNPEAAESGVSVVGGSTLEIGNSAITNNAGRGIRLDGKAYVAATNNAITGNGYNGVEAYGSSHASLWGNTITGNGTKAVPDDPNFSSGVVVHASNLDIDGNQIASHPGTGVRASAATVTSYNNTITGNAGGGVLLYPASQLVMNNDSISRNGGFGLVISLNSVAQLLGANVQFNTGDGIQLQFGSKLNFVAASSASGGNSGYGLQCVDAESSVVGLRMLIVSPPNGQGGVSPACTGF